MNGPRGERGPHFRYTLKNGPNLRYVTVIYAKETP